MSKKSLEQQFYYSIQNINLCDNIEKRENIFNKETGEDAEGVGKKQFKEHGISEKYIFSYSNMQNTLSISRDFSKYLKEYGIVKVNKITPSIAKGFIDMKKEQGASPKTLLTYRAALVKINTAIQMTFNCKGYCRGDDNIKNYHIDKPDIIGRRLYNNQLDTIIDKASPKYMECFNLQKDFGLRINELKNLSINDFNFGTGPDVELVKQGIVNTSNTLHIHSGTKGGLSRYVNIPLDKIEQYRAKIEEYRGHGIVKPFNWVERGPYNKYIKRLSNSLGYGKVGSSHEFRKYFASSLYREQVNDSMSKKEKIEIAREVIKTLGHGRCRDDLIKTYIGNL